MPRKELEKKIVDLVLDSSFWKECVVIVKVAKPLVRVLRIVDGDDRPAMGFIYEAINKAKEEMSKRFQRRKKRVKPYLKIVDSRWDRQLHKNLHAVVYWLNPRFHYNNQEMENHKHTISRLLDVIERYSNENFDLRSK
ncbi:Ribonuclease H-like protein [Dioscorea alata]|uniref:Ribonuclease H-like protein n=1 Tax=Dioscorea alata TaxID=55571 RepID=A0ACB7VEB7_DIOAL|nr:Ribonuclease H-like protein [Dioscorea alata]